MMRNERIKKDGNKKQKDRNYDCGAL